MEKDIYKKSFSDTSLIDHAKYLFPINRSLTGDGTRETLHYFETYFPEFERVNFESGEQVFDWQVPKEWNVNDAFIQHIESGEKFAEFKNLNLHLMGYSEPRDETLDLDELKEKIYTLKDQPDVVPYMTSYYSKNWGFCLSHNQKKNLPKGKYRVFIDSKFSDGLLGLSHSLIKGTSSSEIYFGSYICHPSMLNNELSGPIVLCALMEYVLKEYPNPSMSYRFILLPETIGSIAYLSRFGNDMKKNLKCGFHLSCVGDERAYSYVQTPYANTLADKVLDSALLGKKNFKRYSYLNRGSDERQWCSPGFRLPICTFCRSKFGEYPEYHTSGDNFSVVTEEGLQGSLDVLKSIVDAFEMGEKPKVVLPCEPQLGKRNLYPNTSRLYSDTHPAAERMDILAYCDGTNNVFDISSITNIELKKVIKELKILQENGLIKN